MNMSIMGVPEEERGKTDRKFKEIAEKFPNIERYVHLGTRSSKDAGQDKPKEGLTTRHSLIKMLKVKDKEF